MQYFITAIGTDSGKTLASAILTEALKADYWKPIQAGHPTDTDEVRRLVSNDVSQFHGESIVLGTPASPHAAAKLEGVAINKEGIKMPETSNDLIIEGAGGMMVPLNDHDLVIDLPKMWKVPVVLVVNLYLGCINHTLLSVDYLKRNSMKVKGIIFNGEPNKESEDIILRKSGYPLLFRIPLLKEVNRKTVSGLSNKLKRDWYE